MTSREPSAQWEYVMVDDWKYFRVDFLETNPFKWGHDYYLSGPCGGAPLGLFISVYSSAFRNHFFYDVGCLAFNKHLASFETIPRAVTGKLLAMILVDGLGLQFPKTLQIKKENSPLYRYNPDIRLKEYLQRYNLQGRSRDRFIIGFRYAIHDVEAVPLVKEKEQALNGTRSLQERLRIKRSNRRKARQDYTGFVYFIESRNAIKIGYSKNPRNRLKQLRTGTPDVLKLILEFRASQGRENRLHTMFRDENLTGEWFSKSKRLWRFIGRVKRIQELRQTQI